MEGYEGYDQNFSDDISSEQSMGSPHTPSHYPQINGISSGYSYGTANPYSNTTTTYMNGAPATAATTHGGYSYHPYAQALQPPPPSAQTSTSNPRTSNSSRRRRHNNDRGRNNQTAAVRQANQARASPPVTQSQLKEEEEDTEMYIPRASVDAAYQFGPRPGKERLDRVPEDLREALIIMPYTPDTYPGPYTFYREANEIRAEADPYGTVWFM